MRILFLLFIIVPVIEMWLLIKVGSLIGAFPTIALVLLTAVIGVALLRRQGLSTLIRGNQKLEQGQLPAEEMVEGLILAVSGALLLTPGFVTDFVGFLGLLPYTRRAIVRKLISQGTLQTFSFTQTRFYRPPGDKGGRTIEGEYWRKDQKNNNH